MKDSHPFELPRYCPICGHDRIQPVSNTKSLRLFRCGEGHFFSFEPVKDAPPEPSSTPGEK